MTPTRTASSRTRSWFWCPSATPSAFGGSSPTRNQAGPHLEVGRTVWAICTAQSALESTHWTELDTGGWLPNRDLQSTDLPDCDGSAVSRPTTLPVPTSTPATETSCPTSAELLVAWQASPSFTSAAGITGFANISCWSTWVNAFALGNGNGAVVFVTTPTLHVASSNEGLTFHSQVCGSPSAPAAWKQNPDIAGC